MSSKCLIIYNERPYKLSNALLEFVESFEKYLNCDVWKLNTQYGYHANITEIDWNIIILDRSLFSHELFAINKKYVDFLSKTKAMKVVFFQDEHTNNMARFSFINEAGIDIIFSCLSSEYHSIYFNNTSVIKVLEYLPGYVSDDLLSKSKEYLDKNIERDIDVFYRGRVAPVEWGKGAREKSEIGIKFKEMLSSSNLKLDIEVDEGKRIYGDQWFTILSRSKACLGVESGVSIFDQNDEVKKRVRALRKEQSSISDSCILNIINEFEDRVYYRTISPRHFEAAAFKVCQILFNGYYSGIMKENVHYIPLEKDFSNIDWVLEILNDDKSRDKIVEKSYNDLILSNKYHYKNFINDFEYQVLPQTNYSFSSEMTKDEINLLMKKKGINTVNEIINKFLFNIFPGKSFIFKFIKPIWIKMQTSKGRHSRYNGSI